MVNLSTTFFFSRERKGKKKKKRMVMVSDGYGILPTGFLVNRMQLQDHVVRI